MTRIVIFAALFALMQLSCTRHDPAPVPCTRVIQDGVVIAEYEESCEVLDCPCADGSCADIVVNGPDTLQVLCHSSGYEETIIVDHPGQSVDISGDRSEVLVLFGGDVNGPAASDVNVNSAEIVYVIGNGPGETSISGNLNAHAGEVQVRDLTIQGDVSFNNNAGYSSITNCVIHGDLNIHVPGLVAVDCIVFGNVNVDRDSTSLNNVGIGGMLTVHGVEMTCSDVYGFTDANLNFAVESSEIDGPLDCSGM